MTCPKFKLLHAVPEHHQHEQQCTLPYQDNGLFKFSGASQLQTSTLHSRYFKCPIIVESPRDVPYGDINLQECTICPADTATNPNLSWPALRRPRLPAVALSAGHIVCTLCPLYCPDQGDIVGREYIHSCKFISPYGTSLGDSTIGLGLDFRLPFAILVVFAFVVLLTSDFVVEDDDGLQLLPAYGGLHHKRPQLDFYIFFCPWRPSFVAVLRFGESDFFFCWVKLRIRDPLLCWTLVLLSLENVPENAQNSRFDELSRCSIQLW
jgi:hypothetical protein